MIHSTIYYLFQLEVDRILVSAQLRPKFLLMLRQFGFPQRMSELRKFGSTIFCQFLPQM